MIYINSILPYPPMTQVFFLYEDSIKCGIVQRIKIQVTCDKQGNLIEDAVWQIVPKAGTTSYSIPLENIKSNYEYIYQEALKKCPSFETDYPYAHEKKCPPPIDDEEVLF
jgi:hypothetical protein